MNNNNANSCYSDGEISLTEVWKKTVQYKKVFWIIFGVIFVLSVLLVLVTPEKYSFSQVIKLAYSPDANGRNTVYDDNNKGVVDGFATKVEKIFYPEAIRLYNLQAKEKVVVGSTKFTAEITGNDSLLLSMIGEKKDSDKIKFIFQKTIEVFAGDAKHFIDSRKKSLNESKANLEHRLAELRNFYKDMYRRGISSGKRSTIGTFESKITEMYLNDQNTSMTGLINNINTLQIQILDTHNVVAVTDVIISDWPLGPPKFLLLILSMIVALFFAFLGVFMTDFVNNLKK